MVINGKNWTVEDLKKVVKSIKRKMYKNNTFLKSYKEYKLYIVFYS